MWNANPTEILESAGFQMFLLGLAVENYPAVLAHTETEILDFLRGYERVAAVWIEGGGVRHAIIKGATGDLVQMTNAIPVRDREDAQRWAAMLNSPPTAAEAPAHIGPRLVVSNE